MLRPLVHLYTLTLAVTGSLSRAPLGTGPRHHPGHARPDRWSTERRLGGDRGQTTAEYALVLLGAAAIAALLITWASKSGAVGKLFEAVLSKVIGSVK